MFSFMPLERWCLNHNIRAIVNSEKTVLKSVAQCIVGRRFYRFCHYVLRYNYWHFDKLNMRHQDYSDHSKQIRAASLQKVCLPFLKPAMACELVLMAATASFAFNTTNVACAPTLISVCRDKSFAVFLPIISNTSAICSSFAN